MLKTCTCDTHPLPYVAQLKAHLCVRCGHHIPPEWTSNDQTVGTFYDLLTASVPGVDLSPFIDEAKRRELAGRVKFGHRHLGRDNVVEGKEEASDGGNYCLFESLAARREGRPENMDLILSAAAAFAKAHRDLAEVRFR